MWYLQKCYGVNKLNGYMWECCCWLSDINVNIYKYIEKRNVRELKLIGKTMNSSSLNLSSSFLGH
jgi:hypothetical protein